MTGLIGSNGITGFNSVTGYHGLLGRSVAASEAVTMPVGFNKWTPDFSITRNGDGTYTTDYDPSSDKPSGTSGYISPTGSDSTGDGTSENPWQSPEKAKTEGVTEIIFKDGFYDRDVLQSSAYNFTTDTALVAENTGKAYMGRSNSFSGGSWTQQSSPNTDVYAVTRSATLRVLDDTYRSETDFYAGGDGYLLGYSAQASIAACQANPGSYYISGSTVYVHTWDSRVPDTDVKVCLSVNNIEQTSSITLYIDGMILYGDTPLRYTRTTTNTDKFIAVDSAFVHNPQSDCVDINGVLSPRLVRCITHDGVQDGFNYHNGGTSDTPVYALEVDCIAKRMGVSGETSHNGSTMHDDGSIIRLNCNYSDTYGPVVHDIAGSHSLNLNVTASNCLIANASNSDAGFRAADDNTKMWMRDCSTTGTMEYDRVQVTGFSQIIDIDGFSGVTGSNVGKISVVSGADRAINLSDVLPSCVVDLDFTLSDSYSGTGTDVANIATDDGTPTNYDFEFVGSPTFTGSANDAGAYLELDGSSYIEQSANVGDLFREAGSTNGSPMWIAMAALPTVGATQANFGNTDGNSSRDGIRLLSNTTNNYRFIQIQSSSNNIQIAPTGSFSAEPTLVIITFDTSSAGSEMIWVNSDTGAAWENSYSPVTGTGLAVVPFQFGSAFGAFEMPNGTRIYGGYAGEGILTDSDIAIMLDQINLRHDRTYA